MEENRLHDCDHSAAEGCQDAVPFSNADHDRGSDGSSFPSSALLRPQHFCVVTETYSPEINGVAVTLSHLVNGLCRRGHRVSIVHPRHPIQATSNATECHDPSQDIVVRGLPLPGYHGVRFGLSAYRFLVRTWENQPPVVVYVATEGPLGWSAIRAASHLGIPTVSGFHTNFHRYCKHYRVGWLQDLAFSYLRWFHNRTEYTLVSNQQLLLQLKEAGINNVRILERGVDSQTFSPKHRSAELRRGWGVSDQDLILAYVGRIAAEKNLEVAIDTFHAIRRLRDRTKFVLVGDGPLRSRLQKDHPELIFTGMQTGDRLAQHYASADVFLFPSETETFGNVTLEAMASGLAVIAYDYACAKLHIRHNETGILAPLGAKDTFVDLACDLVNNPLTIQKIRRQARQYVTYLDWQRVVERFEAILMSTDRDGRSLSPSSLTTTGLAT
jgi:glycosyltransferase involved in cell wall biosynthesis